MHVLPNTGSKDASKGRSDPQAAAPKASSADKPRAGSSKGVTTSQRKPEAKTFSRPATRDAVKTGDKGSDKAAGTSGSKRELVVEKQAGHKRRSRSRDRSTSPKRRASSPTMRKSGQLPATSRFILFLPKIINTCSDTLACVV